MRRILILLLTVLPLLVFSQAKISMADAILKGRTTLAPTNLRQLQWIPKTNQFTHLVNSKIVKVNAPDLTTDTLDLLPKIKEAMTALGIKPIEAFPAITWLSADKLRFQTSTEVLTYDLVSGIKRENSFPENAENLDIHPQSYHAAYTVGNELYVSKQGSNLQVAKSEEDGIVYGKSVHRDEFGIHKGTFWSNSGQKLAYYRMDERPVTKYPIYILDSMPAQVREIRYPFAGAKSHFVTIGVFDSQSEKSIYLQTDPETPADTEHYLTNVVWTPDDKYILVAVVNRAQNHMWLKQFDASTGAFVKTIMEETNDKWVEPEHPAVFIPGKSDEFLWESEKDGFNHLYRWNLAGKMLGQVSKGSFPMTNFYGFDEKGNTAFFQTADESGMNRYVWASDLKTGKMTRLNEEEGTHNGLVNSTGEWSLDIFSNLATPRFIYVQSVKNRAERQLVFGAKNPLDGIAMGQTRFINIPSPGGPMLNARMILPPNFDPNQKYPVLMYVYNGPHVQMVTNTWLGGGELWMHHMAQEGVIQLSIDGRGSLNRGAAFENSIHRKCGDAEIEDQVTAAKYLKDQPFVDATRIGIYGWSYGGFMATSLMTRPEAKGIFACGVAGGPVIDWRMYEIMYTERYMDAPQENPAGYDKASLFNYIDNLDGRLLMIHGSSDDVVLWQHSLRYIRECVRKGKQIEYFAYPEHLHNVMGKDRVHLFEKVERFFMDNFKTKVP